MDAQLTITGHVGGAVDFLSTRPNGVSRATFRMACTPRVRRQGEWSDLPTTWLTVVCWRTLAEHVASSFGKGDPVLVAGRLRTEDWTDDEGGQHSRLVIEATAAGHDLNRGTSAFRRASRPESGTEAAAEQTGTDAPTPGGEVPEPAVVAG